MLCERHSERDESANSISARRPESVTSDMFGDGEENLFLNHTEMRSGIPTPDKIQRVLTQMLRSIGCRVSSTLGCLERWMR